MLNDQAVSLADVYAALLAEIRANRARREQQQPDSRSRADDRPCKDRARRDGSGKQWPMAPAGR